MSTHPEDAALRAHRAAVQHLQNLTEAMWAEEDGTDVDWTELGATAPYDGCDDCVVREVATVVVAELEAGGAIRYLGSPDTQAEKWRARHAALRADVEELRRDFSRGLWPDFKGALDRDDEQGQA